MPPKQYLTAGSACPLAIPSPDPAAEPYLVGQSPTTAAGTGSVAINPVIADLNYAFNRHEAQVRAYRAKLDQELDDAAND